mmetsp:Transcript_10183/g.27931  ORF Transcript_10183/g.27931 Transcript_10183/m.27931 type:complete len:110 (+) Transcript_10183:403-732(+)
MSDHAFVALGFHSEGSGLRNNRSVPCMYLRRFARALKYFWWSVVKCIRRVPEVVHSEGSKRHTRHRESLIRTAGTLVQRLSHPSIPPLNQIIVASPIGTHVYVIPCIRV